MSTHSNSSSNNNNDNDRNNYSIFWDDEFENKNEILKKEKTKMLEKLIGRKIKVWCAFSSTTGGMSGKFLGATGMLTAVDDELLCLDNSTFLGRKFISRIEIL